jgi:hypothetical protein
MSSPFQRSFSSKSPFRETAKEKAEMDAAESNPSQPAVEINNTTKPIVPGAGMKGPSPKLANVLERTLYDDDDTGVEPLSNIPQKEINRANQEYKEKTNDPEVQNDSSRH